MVNNNQKEDQEKELSLIDLLIKLKPIFFLVKRNVLFLGIAVILLCAVGVLRRPKGKYLATTTVLLKDESQGGGSGLMSLVSAYGFGSQSGITFDKFKGIGSSDFIIKSVLKKKGSVKGKEDVIAHHLIKHWKLDKAWKKSRKNLFEADYSVAGPNQDTINLILLPKVKKLISMSESKEKLLRVIVTSESEDLALIVSKEIVDEVIKFFKISSVADDVNTKNLLEARIDSLQKDLFRTEQEYADMKDQSYQTVKSKGLLENIRAERNLRILNEMFLEATKQFELINFKILNNNPSISIVDTPNTPLRMEQKSLLVILILYSMLGFILGFVILLIKTYYKTVLNFLKED